MKNLFKVSALLVALVMLITLTACTSKDEGAVTPNETEAASVWDEAQYTEDTEMGDGATTIQVEVKAEDKSITFTLHTDAGTLGDALLTYALIEGENSQYGMFIKRVNGILADFDVDGYYWGVYKNGEYLMTGVDSTVIADGEHYELVRTK